MTCCLTGPESYEGGEFEFRFTNDDGKTEDIICKEIIPKGSIVVFPSFIHHRVKPVTKGTRYSLVMWSCGEPFK